MRALLLLCLLMCQVRAACIPPPNTWDWEAHNWRTNIISFSGTISASSYLVGTRFMKQVKWWDVRPLLGRVNLYLGNQTNAMLCPIIHTWSSTTDVGHDALSGFVEADFAEATGLTGNATTKSMGINQGFGVNLSDFTTVNNFHMAAYVRTSSAEASYVMGIAYGGANATVGLPVSYVNNSYLEISSAANQVNVADAGGVGFYLATKTASNARVLYKNGASILSSSATDAAALAGGSPLVHAFNSAGTPTAWNSRALSYYAFGYGITADRQAAYRIAVRNVQLALGRNVE